MALNFPANPVDGQVYGTYTYNATKGVWSSSSIPQAYTVSETVPPNPRNGDVWFNSANAKSYVYYSDDDSSQWVEIGGQEGAPGTPSSLGAVPGVNVSGVADGNALIYDAASGNWIPGEGGGKFTVSDTAPSEAENGDTWFKSDDGKTYIYYVDTDGGQWVEIASNTTGYLDIGQLNDVTIVSPTTGQALTYDGSGWVNATPASTLGSLTDVDTAGVADGQALVYDSANSEWVPGSAAPSGMNTQNTNTVAIDFADNVPFEKRTVTGDISFTGSNYSEGITKQILLEGDSVKRNLAFPAGWNFVNNDKPVSIGADKDNLLSLYSFGTSESNVIATWEGESSFEPIQATGGTETEVLIGNVTYRVHTFSTTDIFIVSDPGSFREVEYLVVAGGGGGGFGSRGGGAGAGGLLTSVQGENSGGGAISSNPYTVSATNYPVIVGAGGTTSSYGTDNAARGGQNGSNSSFAGIIAVGGGGGGASDSSGTDRSPKSGGSGGGGWYQHGAGGAGTAGQGYAGGTSSTSAPYGAGGGGAGEVGGNAQSGQYGGDGVPSSITGNTTFYAGGGSSSDYGGASNAPGGLGGGGIGVNNTATPPTTANGQINTGGGGGASGVGGSGIVIIRYPITDPT